MKIRKEKLFGPVTLLLSLLGFAFFFATPSFGAVRCETQYGGGQVCVTTGQLQVNKKVWDVGSNQYVDNLVAKGVHHFVSGEEVTFQIRIQNVGNTNLDNVIFTDSLPPFMAFTSGNLSENLGTLNPGQVVERIVKARIVNSDQLPLAPSTICDDRTTNFAEAHDLESSDRDTSRVCVENRVKGVTTIPTPVKVIPSTGPDSWALLSLPIFGAAGFYLRKYLGKLK